MINQLLIYSISISMLVIILVFINRVIYYSDRNYNIPTTKHPIKPTTTSSYKPKPTANLILNNVHPEKKFYWANNERLK